jgi:hypothetical protein
MTRRQRHFLLFGAALGGGLFALAIGPAGAAENAAPHHRQPPAERYQSVPYGGWCADHRLATLTLKQRFEGRNLARLRAAEAELAPGFVAGKATTGLHLLAAYQEELEKRHPDAAVAASYLALASTVPITAGRYRQVNALLCVSTTRALARSIEAEAEAQRRQMAR